MDDEAHAPCGAAHLHRGAAQSERIFPFHGGSFREVFKTPHRAALVLIESIRLAVGTDAVINKDYGLVLLPAVFGSQGGYLLAPLIDVVLREIGGVGSVVADVISILHLKKTPCVEEIGEVFAGRHAHHLREMELVVFSEHRVHLPLVARSGSAPERIPAEEFVETRVEALVMARIVIIEPELKPHAGGAPRVVLMKVFTSVETPALHGGIVGTRAVGAAIEESHVGEDIVALLSASGHIHRPLIEMAHLVSRSPEVACGKFADDAADSARIVGRAPPCSVHESTLTQRDAEMAVVEILVIVVARHGVTFESVVIVAPRFFLRFDHVGG